MVAHGSHKSILSTGFPRLSKADRKGLYGAVLLRLGRGVACWEWQLQ